MAGWDPDFLQKAINQCTNASGMIEDCQIFTTNYNAPTECKFTPPRDAAKEKCAGPRDGLCGGNVRIDGSHGAAPDAATAGSSKQQVDSAQVAPAPPPPPAAPPAAAPPVAAPPPAAPLATPSPVVLPNVKVVIEEVVVEETVTQWVKRAAPTVAPEAHPYDHPHVRHIPNHHLLHRRHGHHHF